MLRKSGPLWAAVLTLLAGCDLFSTREILPKPSEIRSFQGLLRLGDSLTFIVRESLREHGTATEKQLLSERRLVFAYKGDSLVGGDTLKIVSLRILEKSTGALIEQGTRLLRFSGDGVLLQNTSTGGGARFYPLKAAAAGDTTAYLALPALFSEGWTAKQSLGVLNVNRDLAGSDTLDYQGHSEVSWRIAETVLDGDSALVQGNYWYGASGLLKAEQTWPDFGWRDADASIPGKVDLYRRLDRQ